MTNFIAGIHASDLASAPVGVEGHRVARLIPGGHMRGARIATALVAILAARSALAEPDRVEIELMTYPEIQFAIHQGKTTVLVFNGGTEQRGPHAVLGGHTFIARRAARALPPQLGNPLGAPGPP